MSSPRLIRWSGLPLVLAGFCVALFVLIHPFGELDVAALAPEWRWAVAHSFHIIGLTLVLLGLVGLYGRQQEQVGGLGLAGFVLAFIGTALTIGVVMTALTPFPIVAVNAPALLADGGPILSASPPPVLLFGIVAYFLGYVLFGIATIRAAVLPRLGTLFFLIGALIFSVPPKPIGPAPYLVPFVGGLVFGLGLVWLGIALWSGKAKAAASS